MTDTDGKVINITGSVLDRMYSRQSSSPYICKLAFDLDCKVNWNSLRKFGSRLWNNSQSNPNHMFRLFGDSQMMLEEASRFVLDADAPCGKYLKLARAVYPTFLKGEAVNYFDLLYMRHYKVENLHRQVDYSIDLEAWREDREAQEIYAFALVLYAETHIEFLSPQEREKLNSTVSNLADSLDSLNSAVGGWCRAWLGEQTTLVLHPEYLRHHAHQVFELVE